jgi:hypothetical protein
MPKHSQATIASMIGEVFMLHSNLLMEAMRQPWTEIVKEQINSDPWMDLYGIDHPKKGVELWASFMECITFHLQPMFRYDTAEAQRFHISKGLKT